MPICDKADIINLCMIHVCVCVLPYPPEVFPVGLLGDVVFGVEFSLQGAKASPLRDVFFAEHACHLQHRLIKSLDLTSNGKYCSSNLKGQSIPKITKMHNNPLTL